MEDRKEYLYEYDEVSLEEVGPEPQAIQARAEALHADLCDGRVAKKVPHHGEAEYLLRVIIALLKGRNGADRYIQAKLRSAVGGLGFDIQVTPKEECGRNSKCPHHDHSDDVVARWLLRQRAARRRERKTE